MRLPLIFLFLTSFLCASAQTEDDSFSLGIIGGVSTTWLINKNTFNAGEEVNVNTTFGGNLGISGLYSFNNAAGVYLALLYSGHNQSYRGEIIPEISFENKIKLIYLDMPVLFRLQSKKGSYFELGPQLSILMSAKENFTSSPNSGLNREDYKNKDFRENFDNTNISAVLGFGFDFDASEVIMVSTGLRFGYSFTDVTKEFSETEMALLETANQLSYTSILSHQAENNVFKYEPTTRFFGGLRVGVAYRL